MWMVASGDLEALRNILVQPYPHDLFPPAYQQAFQGISQQFTPQFALSQTYAGPGGDPNNPHTANLGGGTVGLIDPSPSINWGDTIQNAIGAGIDLLQSNFGNPGQQATNQSILNQGAPAPTGSTQATSTVQPTLLSVPGAAGNDSGWQKWALGIMGAVLAFVLYKNYK